MIALNLKDHFLKIPSVFKVKKIVLSLFFALLIISGCTAVDPSQRSVQKYPERVTYQSDLTDPAAKALFYFSEFRMLGAENRWEEAITSLEQAISFDPQSEYLQLVLARAYLHRQQPEQAAAILKALLADHPENVEGYELLGDVCSFQQNYSLAATHFRRALELRPESAVLSLRLAMTLAQLGKNGEAITRLEGLLKKHPDADLARLTLARLYLHEQEPEKAFTAYRKLLEQQPDQPQVVLEYGKLLQQQDPAAALELYRSFIARNPRVAAVRQQLAQDLLRQNQLDEAFVQLRAIQQQFPEDRKTLNQIGLIQLEKKQWFDAERTFQKLLQLEDGDDDSRYYLSVALSEQHKFTAAIAVLEPLSQGSAIYPEAALQLAYLYKRVDQNSKAISILRQLLQQGSERQSLYYYLVIFLGDSGEYRQALDVARAGVEKYPEDVQLLYQLGSLHEKLGEHQPAIQMMEKILSLDPANPDALNFLAYGQAESGVDLDLALQRAEKAFVLKPSGYIIDTLGWVYFKLGRYSESRKKLEKAVELHPEDAVIHEHLGDLYRALKLWKKAESAYREALKLAPDSVPVKEKLKLLLERK